MSVPYQFIANELKAKKVIPFLGSGASIAGVPVAPDRLPDGKRLATELIDRVGSYPGEASDPLTKVSQFYEECVAGRTPLYNDLRRRFYETQTQTEPTQLASTLASIEQPLLIVTTNYDPIVELAYQKRGRAYTVLSHVTNRDHRYFRYVLVQQSRSPGEVKTVSATKLDLDDYGESPIIYKIHGTFGDHPSWSEYDTIVITENDYVDFLVMTGQKKFPPALERAFQEHHILYLGYSLEDWNFRVLLRKLRETAQLGQDYRSWAIQLQPSEIEKRFWEKRNVDLYDVDLCDFVENLKALL
jgi:hypothetical protein